MHCPRSPVSPIHHMQQRLARSWGACSWLGSQEHRCKSKHVYQSKQHQSTTGRTKSKCVHEDCKRIFRWPWLRSLLRLFLCYRGHMFHEFLGLTSRSGAIIPNAKSMRITLKSSRVKVGVNQCGLRPCRDFVHAWSAGVWKHFLPRLPFCLQMFCQDLRTDIDTMLWIYTFVDLSSLLLKPFGKKRDYTCVQYRNIKYKS